MDGQLLVEALHSAFRRRASERFVDWSNRYVAQRSEEGRLHEVPYQYTADDYEVFPRYLVDQAILVDAERWVPSDFQSLEHARATLRTVVLAATDAMVENVDEQGKGRTAIADERSGFVDWLDSVAESELIDVEPFGYRRTLADSERQQILSSLAHGFWVANDDWWPKPDDNVFTVQVDETDLDLGEVVRTALKTLSVDRVLDVREFGQSVEVDLALANPAYNGAEALITSDQYDWLIFLSHHGTAYFSEGELADFVRATLA